MYDQSFFKEQWERVLLKTLESNANSKRIWPHCDQNFEILVYVAHSAQCGQIRFQFLKFLCDFKNNSATLWQGAGES